MNVPPMCNSVKELGLSWPEHKCDHKAVWHVIDKTVSQQWDFCERHLQMNLHHEHTYSIFPAKDYSRPKRSFDREYMGEPFITDKSRCFRCGGEMVPLKRKDVMVCKECGGKER